MTRRRLAEAIRVACVVVGLVGLSSSAHALETDACIERTRAFHREHGLTPAAHVSRVLAEDEVVVTTFSGLERCVRIDVLGAEILELDAELYDDEGALVARDETRGPSPSVTACGVRGPIHLALRVIAGRGRIDLVASEGRTRGPSGIAPCAFGTPGVAQGAFPLPVSVPRAEDVLAAALARERARVLGAPTIVTTTAGPSAARVNVTPGCHVFLVVPELPIDADVVVRADGPNGPDTQRLAPLTTETVLACTDSTSVTIAIESTMPGRFALAALDVVIDSSDVPTGLSGAAAARFALEAGRARARGMRRVAIAVSAMGREPWALPIVLERGECAFVIAASSGGSLSLGLTDAEGRLLATDTSGANVAAAWHCAGAEGETRAWIRSSSERRRRVVYALFAERSR